MIINSYFSDGGVPAVGLHPTIRVWRVQHDDNVLVSESAMEEVGDGFYKFAFSQYESQYGYIFRADGGPTLTATDRYSIAATETVHLQDDQLNAIADRVWDEPVADHTSAGTAGEMLAQTKADTKSVVIGQSALNSLIGTLLKYEKNRTRIDVAAKTLTVYDDDGITALTVFDLKDHQGNPSITEVSERSPVV